MALLPVVFMLVLSNKAVQAYAVERATGYLSRELGVDAHVGKVSYRPLSIISLQDVYLSDTAHDTLAYIGDLYGDVQIRPLLDGIVNIDVLTLDEVRFRLTTDADGRTNLQFLIDYLQRPDAVFPNLHIDRLRLTRSRIQLDFDQQTPKNTFDPNHLLFDDLNVVLSGCHTDDSSRVNLQGLSFTERSGLCVKELSLKAEIDSSHVCVRDLTLRLPHSNMLLSSLCVQYDSLAQLSDWRMLRQHGRVELDLTTSEWDGGDLVSLWPGCRELTAPVHLSAALGGTYDDFHMDRFSLQYGQHTYLSCNGMIMGLSDPNETFVMLDASPAATCNADIQSLTNCLQGRPVTLPQPVLNLGRTNFRGNMTGYFSDLVAYGIVTTEVGTVNIDLMLSYNPDAKNLNFDGQVATKSFQLNRLLGEKAQLGELTMDVMVSGNKRQGSKLHGHVTGEINALDYRGFTYRGIQLSGKYDEKNLTAGLSYADSVGSVLLDMDMHYINKLWDIDLSARLDSIHPAGMHLADSTLQAKFSLLVQSHLKIKDPDHIKGYLHLDSLRIARNGQEILIPYLYVTSKGDNKNRSILINSPVVYGSMDGEFTFTTLPQNLQYLIAAHLPALPPLAVEKKTSGNDFTYHFTIPPITEIAYMLNTSWSIDDTTVIDGFFNDHRDRVGLELTTGLLDFGKTSIDHVQLRMGNPADSMLADLKFEYQTWLDTTKIALHSGILDNTVFAGIAFANTMEKTFEGRINTSTRFNQPQQEGRMVDLLCTILPSEMIISDSLWHVRRGTIRYDEEAVTVRDVAFEGTDQYVRVGGKSTINDSTNVIGVDMKNFNLAYLSEVLYMPDIKLMGWVTGKAAVGQVLKKPVLYADLHCRQFGLNAHPLGNLDAKARYNHQQQQIDLGGSLVLASNDTNRVTGYISPVRGDMLLDIDLNHAPVTFIKPYLKSFSTKLGGTASGKLYVGGELEHVEVWGNMLAEDAYLGVDILNTVFHFTDSVIMQKEAIIFPNIRIRDELGHKGRLNGVLKHKYFTDFDYNLNIDMDDILVFDANEWESPDFYGHVLADGHVSLTGDVNKIDIAVNATPQKYSYIGVPTNTSSSAADNQFITFVNRQEERQKSPEERRKRLVEQLPTTKTNIDLQVDVTPDLEVQLVFDSRTSDVITAHGSGNLKVDLDNNADISIYGNYDITEGEYNFSLQGTMYKKFLVAEGSSISFDGDPLKGQLDIDATYQTTASLNDLLDEAMLADISNHMIKVLCIAHITGPLQEPSITFDIQLPNADEEVQRRVRSAINTEEMMSQQMVFLLLTGRFYNPEVMKNSTNYSAELAASFATATLSSQLNYWLSQISDNVNMGVNYHQDSQEAEVNRSIEVNISTNLLNDRLLINSNLGYRQQYGDNDFIGDLDLEYKLIPSGRLRLKAYNQTNDKLYSTSLYTQGLGIMYKEDFDTWKSLFNRYHEALRKKTDEEKAEEAQKKAEEKQQKADVQAAKKALREDRRRRHKEYVEQQKALKQQQP
ncbi:MAG: translocation/assembly module TamB domain-containing protein [Paludibacteraceae bacterium]|nr:translocation/assembly module TamB domain-containing protein [Paludibacteraceae bacterium]